MNRKNIGLIALIAMAILALPAFAHKASAAEASLCISKDKTAGQLKALKTAQDEGNYSEELRIKRALLKNALVCANEEASNLKDSVAALDDINDQVKDLKDKASTSLAEAIDFYNSKLDKVSSLSLKGVQDVSKEVLDARNEKYGPVIRRNLNLVLWTRNQKLFGTAESRLAQIEKSAIAFKVIDNGEIRDLLSSAQDSFSAAKDLNGQAAEIVLSSGPADKSFPLIQSSLDKLSETYKDFISLGDLIHGLVPQSDSQ